MPIKFSLFNQYCSMTRQQAVSKLAFVLFSFFMHGSAHAAFDSIINIRPYVSASTSYDDNVFRFSSLQQARLLGYNQLGDSSVTVSAGLNVGVRVSRQQFQFTLGLTDAKYNQFKNLDFTGNNIDAKWNWVMGNHVFGSLGYTENESAPGFQENRLTNGGQNLRTATAKTGDINWSLHPNWTLFGRFAQTSADNSNTASKILNREVDNTELGIRFQNTVNTQISLSYQDSETRFPVRTAVDLQQFGNKNDTKQLILNLGWAPTRLLTFNGRFAEVSTEYPQVKGRDFSGFSQSWGVSYSITPYTTISGRAYQDVNAIQDVVSTYVQATGLSMNISWQTTPKIAVGGGVDSSERRFLGSAGATVAGVFGDTERVDSAHSINAFVSYVPTQHISARLNYSGNFFDSNRSGLGVDDNLISASLSYQF